jgi:hypothetical protein
LGEVRRARPSGSRNAYFPSTVNIAIHTSWKVLDLKHDVLARSKNPISLHLNFGEMREHLRRHCVRTQGTPSLVVVPPNDTSGHSLYTARIPAAAYPSTSE